MSEFIDEDDHERKLERRARARLAAFVKAWTCDQGEKGSPEYLVATQRAREIGIRYGILTPDAGFYLVNQAAVYMACNCLTRVFNAQQLLAIIDGQDNASRQCDWIEAQRFERKLFDLFSPILIGILEIYRESDYALTVASGFKVYKSRNRSGRRFIDRLVTSKSVSVLVG